MLAPKCAIGPPSVRCTNKGRSICNKQQQRASIIRSHCWSPGHGDVVSAAEESCASMAHLVHIGAWQKRRLTSNIGRAPLCALPYTPRQGLVHLLGVDCRNKSSVGILQPFKDTILQIAAQTCTDADRCRTLRNLGTALMPLRPLKGQFYLINRTFPHILAAGSSVLWSIPKN